MLQIVSPALMFVLALSYSVSAAEIVTIAGTGQDEFSGDGGPALKAGVGQPFGLEIGPDGALYYCEFSNHIVRRLDLKTKKLTTVAGTGRKAGFAGDGGPATKARMNQPHELRFDAEGNYYISDMLSQAVRRVDGKTGVMTSVAGTGKAGFAGDDGPASAALFDLPISVLLDHSNGLLICDIKNHRVRRVDLGTGIVSTFAGTGEKKATPNGAPLAGTPLNGPRTLALEADGNVIIVLREGNAVYRANLKTKTLQHIAGTGKQGFSGDGGDAKLAQLAGPKGATVDREGNILLCDTENHTIRIINKSTGVIESLIGDGKAGDGPEGDPKECRLNRPHGVFVDATGNIYLGDSNNNKVRKLTSK
jgi:DNA-binding beta-propeller fold protein YncE